MSLTSQSVGHVPGLSSQNFAEIWRPMTRCFMLYLFKYFFTFSEDDKSFSLTQQKVSQSYTLKKINTIILKFVKKFVSTIF